MRFYWLIIGILGVWRLTDLLHAEDGPWHAFRHSRALLAAVGLQEAASCFYCLSVWVALPVAAWIGESWMERILLWPALAGGAALIQRVVQHHAPLPATYIEDDSGPADVSTASSKDTFNVQLRQPE
jgi:hypothetical protein